MDHHSTLATLDWVKRVNCSWLVRGGLRENADAWLELLSLLDDGRMLPSCHAARAMCYLREPLQDPKPWFYAGLFSLATAEEARRFLSVHRVTKAIVPTMVDDAEVVLWLDRVGSETRELVQKLREGLARLPRS